MKKIDKNKMKVINGGGSFSIGLILGLGSIINFLIGVIDGYTRPLACRGWLIWERCLNKKWNK